MRYQNRGALFTCEPGHVNTLAPHKRPLHTLIPGFMEKDGVRIGFGIMGAWNQAQAHAQFVSAIADFGLSIQEALEAGRFTKRTVDGCDVKVEALVPASTQAELATLGHDVETVPARTSGDFEVGQAVMGRPDGAHFGASDPRHDGQRSPKGPVLRALATAGNPDEGDAAVRAGAIGEGEGPAVCLRDLPAEHEADARPVRLGRIEGHEQVGSPRGPALVFDAYLHPVVDGRPRERHPAIGLERGVGRVMHQIDEELIELVGIGPDAEGRAARNGWRYPRLECGRATNPRFDVDVRAVRRRQLGQSSVGGHESAQRFRTPGDHAEAARDIRREIRRRGLTCHQRAEPYVRSIG